MFARLSKRLFDVLFSLLVLVALAPVFLIFAVLIKLTSKGPVFYKQQRVGRHGEIFGLLKFRTMIVNADQLGARVTIGRDPRITGIGHFLRKTKLDELPQFFNVFKGEMSTVGPRPEVPEYVAYWPESDKRLVLSVRPGITDNAALAFSNESELLGEQDDPQSYYISSLIPQKLQLYKSYVRNWSFTGDLVLIFRTGMRVFRSK